MMQWLFKDSINYQGKKVTQDSRKFEILVELYLKDQYPLENWKLTKATRDGNKDLESICEFNGSSMWAEVKYTIHSNDNISSRKFDSTLVSSMFEKNLIKIFFITNTTIGSKLIERVKKFYYLSSVKKISFVDGYSLVFWIKKNPKIENFFFKRPINYTLPSLPMVHLKCIRILCKSDSYTIDSVLEEQNIYPLYLSRNYILEGEFTAVGFDTVPLLLYCNDILVYDGKVSPEITTFSLDINQTNETFIANKEYPLNLYYKIGKKRYDCGNFSLKFAVMGKIHKNHAQIYLTIDEEICASYKKIFNIYGPQSSGKSWILNNLKNDLLAKGNKNQRIIYVSFNGKDADIADICRVIFTLVFDYYNLSISEKTLLRYAQEHSEKNTFFNHCNIKNIIAALQNNDYSMLQSIIKGSISSKTETIFTSKQCFNYDKVYFIDNIHLLSSDNNAILNVLLEAFNPLHNITFVLTGRNILKGANVKNISLNYLSDDEILDTINERISVHIKSLNEILPQKHYLMYPGLLYSFLHNINENTTINEIKKYYIDTFQENAIQYVKGNFRFDNLILLLVCFVREGIPIDFLLAIDSAKLSELLNLQIIIQKHGYIYPNFERWNNDIPEKILSEYKNEIIQNIFDFVEKDIERNAIYQCALMTHYLEYYNQYFDTLFFRIKTLFKNNKYNQVVLLCESLLEKKVFFIGDNEKIDYLKYFLAFSYMHCDASKDAREIFLEITKNYQLKVKTTLYFDAASQIIDAEYWGFRNYKNLLKEINNFRKEWKVALLNDINVHSRAYLTATNRMMVTYLALDYFDLAKKWFRKNIKLATILDAREHIGYTYMDYAKGIYHKDLSLALKYLEIADSFFLTPSEKRRHLDCQCEIAYVKMLLKKESIHKLLCAQEALFENQYWIQYYKCYLKLAVCYIVIGDNAKAYECLLEAEASIILKNDERVKYLSNIIEAFLYNETISYHNLNLKGTSYQKILDNNKLYYPAEKAVIYTIKSKNKMYYLDPRTW